MCQKTKSPGGRSVLVAALSVQHRQVKSVEINLNSNLRIYPMYMKFYNPASSPMPLEVSIIRPWHFLFVLVML